MLVREALFQVMRELGLTTVFGNIGSTEEKMFSDFPDDFRYVLALHEAAAVATADAYAQSTGQPVHVNLHTAAGTGDSLGAVITAWYNRTPMIITAGQQTRQMLLMEPYLTNKSPNTQLAPWVKWSHEPTRPQDVPAAFIRAYATAVQSPPGPVFLSLPMDDMDHDCPAMPPLRRVNPRISADLSLLQPVVDALNNARQPVLIMGGAVDQPGGWQAGVALAERLQCKVLGAPLEGRLGFPETHPLYYGQAAPSAYPLREQLAGSDLVVVIGAPVFRFYPHTYGSALPDDTRLLHLTDSSDEAARAPYGESFLVDPGRACQTLAEAVTQTHRLPPTPMPEPDPPVPQGPQITADQLYFALAQQRPDNLVITQETPSNAAASHLRLPISEPGSYFSMSSGVLGYGLPASVGAALAERDTERNRKVLALLGDGATQYSIQAFWNAAQLDLNIFIVILRNREYAVLKSYQNFFSLKGVPALDIPGVDLQLIAQGYGVPGETVSEVSQLDAAISRGFAHHGCYVLQVDVSDEVPPLLGASGPRTENDTKA